MKDFIIIIFNNRHNYMFENDNNSNLLLNQLVLTLFFNRFS